MARRKTISGQQVVRNVKLSTIMGRVAFRVGFDGARKGEPWPADYNTMHPRDQWSFERGRQFGIVAPHVTLNDGRSVTRQACEAFAQALSSGAIR